jgi:hypothetical protein
MAVKISGKPITAKPAYAEHLQAPVIGQVTTSKGTGPEKTVEHQAGKKFHPVEDMMFIEFHGGRTVNLGNYESARVDVAIRVPCTKVELEDAYDWATSWVSDKIIEAVKGLKNGDQI